MGFDNECILNIQSLAGEYFCPVCRLLVYPNEAIQSQCTHLYCKPCLTYIVSTTRACPYDGYLVTEADSKPLLESNKTLAETIGKIGVHCLFHRSGCTWQGSLTDCTTHCLGCSFGNSPVVCNRCGIQIVHRQVQEHAQNCAGMQQPVPHVQGIQEGINTANAVVAEQNQASKGGEIISQPQNTTAPSAQNSNQLLSHSQSVSQSALAHDQWYQQQRYMQYCQQYPGYDPYQQYYPHQQPVQSYQQQNLQAQVAVNPGQLQFPAHGPPPSQLQVQPQVQFQPQPQLQMQSHASGQSSFHTQASIPAQHQTSSASNQHQLYSTMQPSQNTVPANAMTAIQSTHNQPYPQIHPLPQSQGPHNPQIVQYHQPQPPVHYPLPTVQAQPPGLSIPQHHSLPQYQPSSQLTQNTVVQQSSQAHSAHRPVIQPNQAANHPVQPQAQSHPQHPSAQAVTGHNSYPHSHPYQHHAGGIQHPSHVLSSQTGNYVQSQHPLPVQSQIPHPTPQLQASTSQQHGYSHTQQHQVMQSMPQSFPSHMMQQPVVTGQSSGIGPNLSHPRAPFAQHQGPVPSSRPSGLLQAQQQPSVQQMAHNATISQGRHVAPNLSSQSQSLPQSNGSQNLLQPGHVQFQSGSSLGPANYSSRTNTTVYAELQSVHIQRPTTGYSPQKNSFASDTKGDHILGKSSSGKMIESASQNACKKETSSALDTSCSEAEIVDMVTVTSDTSNKVMDGTISVEEAQPLKSDTNDMEPFHVPNECEAEVTDSAKSPIRELKQEKASDFDHENAVDDVPLTSHGNSDVSNDQKDAGGMDNKKAEVISSGNPDTADLSLTGIDPDQQAGTVKENLKPRIDNDSSAVGVSATPLLDYTKNLSQSLATSHAEPSNASKGLEQFSCSLPHDSSRHQQSMNLGSYSSVVMSEKPPLSRPSTFPVPNHAHMQGHSHHVRPPFQSDLGSQGAPVFPRDHFHAPHQKQPHGSFHTDAPHAGYGAVGSAALHGRGPEQMGSDSQTFEPVSAGPRYHTQTHQPPHHVGGYFHPGPSGHRRLDRVDSLHNYPAWPSSSVPSNIMELDMPLENSHTSGMGIERFRHQHEGKGSTFSSHPIFDRRDFDEPRKFHSLPYEDFRPDEKERNFVSSLKPFDHRAPHGLGADHPILSFDKGMHGTNYDGRSNFDVDANIGPSKFFPPFGNGRVFPDDRREREMPETRNDMFGRRDVHSQLDLLNSSGVSRNMDDDHCFGGSSRLPSRVYSGFSGFRGNTLGVDTADRREFNPFNDPLDSTVILSKQSGTSFPESGFSFRPSLLNKVEFERFGAHDSLEPGLGSIGNFDKRSDILPSCGDFLGPRSITGKWHMGEFTDVGGIQNNTVLGQFSGPRRFGELSFRSSHSLQKYQCDGGLFVDPNENDNSSMRKAPGLGWCRICCVECATLEGLEMHSQTRDHQKAAMDIVLNIKKQIAWKSRNVSDENSFDMTDKHTMASLDPLGNA